MMPKQEAYRKQAEKVMAQMKKRHFDPYYCDTKEDAFNKVLEIMEKGSSVANGGSVTLMETGILEYVKSHPEEYTYIPRSGKTDEERRAGHAKAMMADYYLMSSNAFTEDGKLVNIDGNGNRVSALCYGPKYVIVVVSMNKMVPDEESAYKRIREKACPPNCIRLGYETPCRETGFCAECTSTASICDLFVTVRLSRYEGRIKVILVGEELGY